MAQIIPCTSSAVFPLPFTIHNKDTEDGYNYDEYSYDAPPKKYSSDVFTFEDDQKKKIVITLTGYSVHPDVQDVYVLDEETKSVEIDHDYDEPFFTKEFYSNNRKFIFYTENISKTFEVLNDETEVLMIRIPKKKRVFAEPDMFKAMVVG